MWRAYGGFIKGGYAETIFQVDLHFSCAPVVWHLGTGNIDLRCTREMSFFSKLQKGNFEREDSENTNLGETLLLHMQLQF